MERMKSYLQRLLVLMCFFCFAGKASATHIYGADFFYTYVSGLKYNITLVIYGDCSGGAISNLYGATPQVEIYNGTSLITTIGLSQVGTSTGVEVTPVCASQLNNTTCVSSTGTVPGVKKFTYTGSYTLSTTSANWKFRFTGSVSTTGGGSAGRSNSITNIASGSIMALEATLNNVSAPNSSPTYTTIPTPFFCDNVPANNNPGAVDPDNDALSYGLVPGLESTGGTVTYVSPYTATNPLAVSSGSFSFSSTTGQLSFTPNLIQRSLVVNTVYEYRGTTLVGTSMREMTFVVLNCSNNPPTGGMSLASTGTFSSGNTVLTLCRIPGNLTFKINPTDYEGDTINMTVTGLPTGATYSITGNNTTAPSASFTWNLNTITAGTYNFYVTYIDNGCPLSSKQTLVYTVVIKQEPAVTVNFLTPATCTKKATFKMTPNGGSSPWSISVQQGSTTLHYFPGLTGSQLDSLLPGTYNLHIVNAGGCVKDTSITIQPPPAIIPSVTMVKPSCFGISDGSITLYAGGGTTPYTYAIGSGSFGSGNTFNSLAGGTYTLYIHDGFDCVKDTTVTLTQPAQISLALQVAKPRCNYYSSGLVTLTASNGFAPYQYAQGSGSYSSSNTFSSLPSGSYIFHAKDANGCIRDSVFILQDSIIVHATALVTDILCNSANTGAVSITGNSGNSPYLYRMGSGSLSSSNNFTSLTAATYNFHVQDVDSCYLDTAIAVIQPTPITSTSVIIDASCKGNSNGSIATTATGGVGPYTYAIGSGSYSSTNSFTGLAAGNYTVHIKDANNCIKDTLIAVNEPAKFIFSNIAIVQPICYNGSNGTITITASGGTTPYTYAINASPFVSGYVFNGISAGSYAMHIKDTKGCTADSVITVGQPTPIVPTLAVKQSTCTPLNDGKVIVYATGGVPSYTYAVGTGSYTTANTFTPFAAGTYTFHIQDSRTCIKDTTITVKDSTVVTASYALTNVKCYTGNTGAILVTPLTGTSPYTFATNTNPFQSSGNFTGLIAGAYTVHIRDVLGCTKDTSVTLTEPTELLQSVSVTNPTCYGFANASVLIFGFGGTSPYAYAYGGNTYQASTSFTGLTAGNYTFHVKDANGCIHDTTFTITQPSPLKYDSLLLADVLCFGTASGKATVYPSGATPPYMYTFDFSGFGSNPVITGLAVGTHVIKLKDANDCRKDTVITLKQPIKLVMLAPDITYPTCDGYTDASVILFGKGGMHPYSYAIDSSAYSPDSSFKKLTQGSYVFHLQDSNGCKVDTTLTLNGYPPIVVKDLLTQDISCFGLSDGKISLAGDGGVPPFVYRLDNGPDKTDNHFDSLKAGSYRLRVTDSKQCYKDTTTQLTEPEKLVVTTTPLPNDCEDYDNGGQIKTDVRGGTYPYAYTWSYPGIHTADATGLPNGIFKVWVTDAHSCADSASDEVKYDNCCKVFIPNAFTPNGDGKNDYAKILFKGDLKLTVFMIYDRFGREMFRTSDINAGWDGKRNGVVQDLDTYNYYVKGICGNGGTKLVEYKGTIMLVQ